MRNTLEIQAGEGPDFIIGGAPKCGTTTLNRLLNQHPDVGMANEELHFFDADDLLTHKDFFFVARGELIVNDPTSPDGPMLGWYADKFGDLVDFKLRGEDSTTYLSSEIAPKRVKTMLPDAKVIFLLRDPVARLESQYWHGVINGRIHCSLEKALASHENLISGSSYVEGLKRWQSEIGAERILVLLFEDLILDRTATLSRTTEFLGIENILVEDIELWSNRTLYPRWLFLYWQLNRLSPLLVRRRYRTHFSPRSVRRRSFTNKLEWRWFKLLSTAFLTNEQKPEMRQKTWDFLSNQLSIRNKGLDQLLERDLESAWPSFRATV